ncbi:hypothetical protein EDB86DRAFT_979261 [Lactarius hatsudake]|nr:hypothetical protein EDB86DRAFT_979261 [Lactarius hatsudake]
MPGTTNSRQLSEDMGSRPRRLARLVAAGVSLKYPTFLIFLAYTNSSEKSKHQIISAKDTGLAQNSTRIQVPACPSSNLPVGPASRRRDDGVCAQTLIARVASDFCHHTRRLIRCVGADICQGRQDGGVGVAALRLVNSPSYCSCSMRTDPAGCCSWPVEVDVRGREAEGKQFGSFALNKIKCICLAETRLHYDPNAALPFRGLIPAHEYPLIVALYQPEWVYTITFGTGSGGRWSSPGKNRLRWDTVTSQRCGLSPTIIRNIDVCIYRACNSGEFIPIYELLSRCHV